MLKLSWVTVMRRVGLLAVLLSSCAPLDEDFDDELLGVTDQAVTSTAPIRLMAGNLTSGTNQSYTSGEGTRIFQGTHPDVAMLQEFNYGTNSAADIRSFVNTAFGTSFSYVRGASTMQIPNGIVSRWPMIESGEWADPYVSNRDFVYARIDIPGPTDLWAVSVHLLTTSATDRNNEAASLVNYIQTKVPAGDFVVIAGDFNTGSRTESALTTLNAVVQTAGPYPADRNGNNSTNATRAKPYDWVVVSSNLQAYKTATVLGSSSFANGLVADTRVYSPISEISPSLSTDSGATNMQHMGIVRDFVIPGDASAALAVTSPNGGEQWAPSSVHNITWTAGSATTVSLAYTLNGSTYTTIASGISAATGSYTWTLPATTSTTARVRITTTDSGGATDDSDAVFSITAASPANVFINEFMANEPGTDTAGEYIEIVNSGGTAADLSGWKVLDNTSVRHTFAAGTSLAAGKAIVVFGGATAIPAGLTNAVAASTGTLALGNSSDSVVIANASGTTVNSYAYTNGGADGVSFNRNPDAQATGSFVAHNTLSTLLGSPGKRKDGTAF